VLVQADAKWWESARTLQFVDSQEEFAKYGDDLERYDVWESNDYYKSVRYSVFRARMYMTNCLMNMHFRFGPEFSFLRPGLEIKHACEAAEQVGANVEFMGSEMNQVTW